MALDRNSSIPLHEQLRLALLDRILLGDYPVGTYLPTEKELCEEYGISRITARKSLEDLAHSGLIERVQGKGTIISDYRPGRSTSQVLGHKRDMEEQGHRDGGRLLSYKLIPPNPNLLNLYKLPPESEQRFWHFRRLRFLDDTPTAIMNSFVRQEVGDKMLEHNLNDASFYELFQHITGRQVVDSRALITATIASPEIAKTLNTFVGAPLIWFRAVSFLEGGIPIEVVYSLFLAEKYNFETTYYRTRVENQETEFIKQLSFE